MHAKYNLDTFGKVNSFFNSMFLHLTVFEQFKFLMENWLFFGVLRENMAKF